MVKLASLDRKLLRDLWHIRAQALAIALVIACGVATIVMAYGTLRSLEQTKDAYYERYRFAEIFAVLKRAPLSLVDRIALIEGVASVDTRIVEQVVIDVPGMDRPATGQLLSLSEDPETGLNHFAIQLGQRPSPVENDEVVVSENFAEAHELNPGDQFSAIINGRKRLLTIAGIALSPEFVYAIGPGQMVPDDKAFGIIWMNRSALEAAFDLKGAFNEVSVTLMRHAQEPHVIARLDFLLEPYGGVGAYGRVDHFSDTFLRNEFVQLRVIGRAIAPIFLIVAAFLLHIVISRLVETEREQIGLLKAFGYTDRDVGWHYFKFVTAIATIGILIGLVGGVWMGRGLTNIYADFFRFPFLHYEMDLGVVGIAVFVTLLSASAGMASSVRKAVKLAPAVAMAPPAPARYKRTLLEQTTWFRKASTGAHLILRHLEHRPLRALLTSLGVAMSGSLLVTTFYFFDATDELLDVYYFLSQRQDISIGYNQSKDERIYYEASRLPGVLRAEPFRAVPVKLKLGHRVERVSLLGVPEGAQLSRLLDKEGEVITLPQDGVVLTDMLAENLQARPGQDLIVEAMDERRPKVVLPIVGIVEQYVGLSAYMNLAALDRVMGGGKAQSGAHLLVDKSQEAAFFATIKETPAISGATVKASAIQSFRDTIAESMYIMIGFYIGFASIITFGVVYNAARIALSERGRELGSLRVLGFTRAEVTYMLLGELFILVIIALPVGSVLGYAMAAYMAYAFESDLIRIPLVIYPSTLATAACVTLLSAILSAIAVARRVYGLDLISVLKTRE